MDAQVGCVSNARLYTNLYWGSMCIIMRMVRSVIDTIDPSYAGDQDLFNRTHAGELNDYQFENVPS